MSAFPDFCWTHVITLPLDYRPQITSVNLDVEPKKPYKTLRHIKKDTELRWLPKYLMRCLRDEHRNRYRIKGRKRQFHKWFHIKWRIRRSFWKNK